MADKQVCLRPDIKGCPYKQGHVPYISGMKDIPIDQIEEHIIYYCYSTPCMKATEDLLEKIYIKTPEQ